jgi:hypothetical protein
MSNRSQINLSEGQNALGTDAQSSLSAPARDLLTHQTGQVLVEIGNMFINMSPFNEHVDRNTGDLLISIGNKLKSK